MTMPFGRHKGAPVEALPYDYLRWLHDRTDLHEPLRSAVRHAWSHRFGEASAPGDDALPDEEAALYRELIEAGYRALAQRLHPDHGGTDEAIKRLNALMARLRREALAMS